MAKWEYKFLWVDRSCERPSDVFEKLGKSGWEFVAVDDAPNIRQYIFKRPLPPEANHEG